MNRRGFVRMLGMGSVAAPIAGRQMAEQAALKIAGISGGLGQGVSAQAPMSAPQSIGSYASDDQIRKALMIPGVRAQMRSILLEEERCVGLIDPDLAVLRSVSLSAKIAYQRQRNVDRRLVTMENKWPWQRVQSLVQRALGLFG